MNLVHRIEIWGDRHHPKFLDILRIALGLFLLLKGIAFMQNSASLKETIEGQNALFISSGCLEALVYYVMFAHMVGGTLIALGTLTRFACVMQLPIVLVAVFLTGVFISPINAMLWPSVTSLVLLTVFAIIGSGPFSLDNYLLKLEF